MNNTESIVDKLIMSTGYINEAKSSSLEKSSNNNLSIRDCSDSSENYYSSIIEKFHANGELKSMEISFVDSSGNLHSIYKRWYQDGKLFVHSIYKNKKLHGEHKVFDFQGNISLYANYKNGKRNGETKYYRNGILRNHEMFKDGEFDDESDFYRKRSTRSRKKNKDVKPVEEKIVRSDSDQLITKKPYKNDEVVVHNKTLKQFIVSLSDDSKEIEIYFYIVCIFVFVGMIYSILEQIFSL